MEGFGIIWRRPCFPIVLLMFILSCFRVGLVKVMGVLFSDISKSIPMTSADLGMTLGLYYTVGLFVTPIVGGLYYRITQLRLLLVIAALIESGTILIASMATANIHLAIIFAVSGIGHSAIMILCLTALANLAGENFNLLYGLSCCGYAVGMVLFPFAGEELLIAYDWRGVLLILGGLLLNSIPGAMAIRVTPNKVTSRDGAGSRDSAPGNYDSNTENHEEVSVSSSVGYCSSAANGKDDDDAVKHALLTASDEQDATIVNENQSSSSEKLPRRFLAWFRSTEVYADPVCVFIFLSDIVLYFVYTGWHAFLIPHAIQRGVSQRNIIILTFLAAVGNLCSRLAVALFTHRLVDPMTMHLVLTFFSIISLACDAFIPSFYVMLVSAWCSAAAIAGRATLGPMVIRSRISSGNIVIAFAINNVLCSCGFFLGGYLTGLMEDRFSTYDASFKLLAGVDIITFLFMLLPKLVKKPEQNRTSP